ncbi:electron transport protein SCO1/SenC [Abyssogena phaseoliformis symbiont OG214]|uniref:SCO family protein n=1 Tax=Abyssogena phaseoliformis symbiont TaxID=596095 RepID=UPI001934BC98|nr:SCO family protein [Abyssogena phaseoliformis symbiont]BBB22241.1 electron transport protein SCO1/SenC [Abyssogena phaseoliformis symbiont OG214]
MAMKKHNNKRFIAYSDNKDCAKIKKTRNVLLGLSIVMFILAYFLLASPNTNKLTKLQEQVSPSVSLYSSPKSLKDKFPLIDDNNNKITLSEVSKNKWTMLYFGYASCPDVCPIDLSILNQTLTLMKLADKLQVVFISVDPKRDIGRLSDFTQHSNKKFIGLSAKKEVLNKITKALGVYHEVVQTKQRSTKDHSNHKSINMNNHYLINRTTSYLLLDPSLKLTGLLTNPHHAKKIAVALDIIIETLD